MWFAPLGYMTCHAPGHEFRYVLTFSLAGAMSSVVPVKNNAIEGRERITDSECSLCEPSNPSPNKPSIW